VLFFTHHHRLVELAERLPKGVVVVHQLPGPRFSESGEPREQANIRTLFV
jgi:hypothetical protein